MKCLSHAIAAQFLTIKACSAFGISPLAKEIVSIRSRIQSPQSYARKKIKLYQVVKEAIVADTEELIDEEIIDGVVCARGVCVVADDEAPEVCIINEDSNELICEPSENAVEPGLTIAYLWPRALLLVCSVLYGTNFPLGR